MDFRECEYQNEINIFTNELACGLNLNGLFGIMSERDLYYRVVQRLQTARPCSLKTNSIFTYFAEQNSILM